MRADLVFDRPQFLGDLLNVLFRHLSNFLAHPFGAEARKSLFASKCFPQSFSVFPALSINLLDFGLLKKQAKVNKLMDKAGKTEKDWGKHLDANKDFLASAPRKGVKKVTELREQLDKCLNGAFKVAEKLRAVEDEVPALKRQLDQLSAMNSKALQNWSKITKLAGGMAVSVLGMVDGAAGAYEAAERTIIYVNSAIALVLDVEFYGESMFG